MNKLQEGRVCPRCNGNAEDYTQLSDKPHPVAGSVCLCLYCASINVYRADGSLRIMTANELERLRNEDYAAYIKIKITQAGVKEMIEEKLRRN